LSGGAGCRTLGDLAGPALLYAATSIVGAGLSAAINEELNASCQPASDVRRRVRCADGRSWKLRCPEGYACFYEDSEGRPYRCPTDACDEPPESLVTWCR
jgi:hypothetical protein